MREKYKYLGKNTAIFAISSFSTKFFSFLLIPLYTNVLTTEEYGVADLLSTTAILMTYIFSINISEAVLRFALEKKENTQVFAYGMKILKLGSLGVMLFLGTVWGSQLVGWKIEYFIFIFLYFFFTTLYQIMTNYLRAVDKVADVALAGIISTVVMLLGNICFLLIIKLGLTGYLVAQVLGFAFGAIYAIIRARLPIQSYFIMDIDAEISTAMRKYSVPLIFNNISLWINAYLDKYFITAICGVDQNGIYTVAGKISTILTTCYTVFSLAWNVSAIKEFDKDDKDGFISNTYGMYNSFIVLGCSFLILINVPLARLLYAKDFFIAWQYSVVMLLSVMFNAMTAFLGSLFSATTKTNVIAATTVISAIVNIILNIILIPVIGVIGAVIATVACYAVMWSIRWVIIRKMISLKVNLIKDIFVYCLIILQVIFGRMDSHFYLGQIIIFTLIFVVYRDNVYQIFKILLDILKAKKA